MLIKIKLLKNNICYLFTLTPVLLWTLDMFTVNIEYTMMFYYGILTAVLWCVVDTDIGNIGGGVLSWSDAGQNNWWCKKSYDLWWWYTVWFALWRWTISMTMTYYDNDNDYDDKRITMMKKMTLIMIMFWQKYDMIGSYVNNGVESVRWYPSSGVILPFNNLYFLFYCTSC